MHTTGMGIQWPDLLENPHSDSLVNGVYPSVDRIREDADVIMFGGGDITLVTNTLTWTAALYVYSPRAGTFITIAASSISIADGHHVWVVPSARPIVTEVLTLTSGATVPAGGVWIGSRSGTSLKFRGGVGDEGGGSTLASTIEMAATGFSLADATEFDLVQSPLHMTEGVGFLSTLVTAEVVGLVTIEFYSDVAKSKLVYSHSMDLSDGDTLEDHEAFGFELETDGTIYCTVVSNGASGTANLTIRALSTQPSTAPAPLASPYGNGIEDNGGGLPQIAFDSDGGLEFDGTKLAVKNDPGATVKTVRTASGMAVSGAMNDSADETVAYKKRFAAVGLTLTGTSGPPTTGTWVAGDEIRDADGVRWYCLTGGTPGTWELGDCVSETVEGVTSAVGPDGGTELLELTTIGNVGIIHQLQIFAFHATTVETDIQQAFSWRVYETSNARGNEQLDDGMGFARQTYLSAILPAAQSYIEVNDNVVGEIGDPIMVYESASRYEVGRCSAKPTGQLTLKEALVDADPWAIATTRIVMGNEYPNVPFRNTDSGSDRRIFLELQNDGATGDPDLIFRVIAKPMSMGVIK